MEPLSSSQLRASLINADARERKTLTLPPGFPHLPWQESDVLAWLDRRARGRGYLVRWRDGEARGLLVKAAPAPGLPSRAVMCSLCQFTMRFDEVVLYTARRTGEAGARGDTLGAYICADLQCVGRILVPPRSGPLDPPPEVMVENRLRGYFSRLDALIDAVAGRHGRASA